MQKVFVVVIVRITVIIHTTTDFRTKKKNRFMKRQQKSGFSNFLCS